MSIAPDAFTLDHAKTFLQKIDQIKSSDFILDIDVVIEALIAYAQLANVKPFKQLTRAIILRS
jgi:hypothetical protein